MMKNLLISLIVSAGLMSAAHAGDAEAGKTFYQETRTDSKGGTIASCSSCHGADGNSLAATFPKIAGQGERYLIKQLTEIRDGVRPVPLMAAVIEGLTDENIADLAAYLSTETMTGAGAKEELVELGAQIFRAGIEEKGIPACLACHAADGSGVELAGFPRLAGQHDAYTAQQLHAFSAGTRNNDQAAMMRTIAERMHDKEIEAVASYIQGLR